MSSRPTIQGRAQILIGDTTSHGGVVISGSPTTLVEGRPVARVGDMVTCPLCKPHVFPITEGLATFTDNHMAVALHGHKTACGATLIAMPSLPEPLAPAPGSSSTAGGLTGTLGEDVNKLIAMSPTLSSDLKTLESRGWSVEYGPAGAGSTASRQKNLITLDSNLKSNPLQATQVLAHEVGHGMHTLNVDRSTRQSYLNSVLDDEGAATMKNITVQREIIRAGGPDIGITGNEANHPGYKDAYNRFEKDGDYPAAIRKIGSTFGKGENTSNTGQNYEDYYGGEYDKETRKKMGK